MGSDTLYARSKSSIFKKFLKAMKRGAPFIANGRLQWVYLSKRKQLAKAIILLGDVDELTSLDDHLDIIVDREACFVPMLNSDHGSVVDFTELPDGGLRRQRFAQAMTLPFDQLRQLYRTFAPHNAIDDDPAYQKSGDSPSPKVRLVFLLHGIRDYGSWRLEMQHRIAKFETKYKTTEQTTSGRDKPGEKFVVLTPSYGYLPMLPFMLSTVRLIFVRRFMDWYTEAIARYSGSDIEVSFFGHSNGTYILARALLDYKAVKCTAVAFAGSVVPQNFPWDRIIRLEGRVERLRNYLAAGDWVVAIFPRFIEQLREVPGLRNRDELDIGSAGFNGFRDDSADDDQVGFLPGGHSAAFRTNGKTDVKKVSDIVSYLCLPSEAGGKSDAPDADRENWRKKDRGGSYELELNKDPEYILSLASRFSFVVMLCIGYVIGVVYSIFYSLMFGLPPQNIGYSEHLWWLGWPRLLPGGSWVSWSLTMMAIIAGAAALKGVVRSKWILTAIVLYGFIGLGWLSYRLFVAEDVGNLEWTGNLWWIWWPGALVNSTWAWWPLVCVIILLIGKALRIPYFIGLAVICFTLIYLYGVNNIVGEMFGSMLGLWVFNVIFSIVLLLFVLCI